MPIRTQTSPASQKYSLSNVSVIPDGGYTLLEQSLDRTKFYATSLISGRVRRLNVSSDGGRTWSSIKDFNSVMSSGDIVGFLELPSGEILICLSAFGSLTTKIFKSTGWATDPVTATYAEKLTLNAPLSHRYSLNRGCIGTNGVVLASEGGSQTDGLSAMGMTAVNKGSGYTSATITATSGGTGEVLDCNIVGGVIERIAVLNGGTGHTPGVHSFGISGDGTGANWTYTVNAAGYIQTCQATAPDGGGNAATRAYLSTDFGENWTQIFDLYTDVDYKYACGIHLHAMAYDEAWDRIWLQFGDNTGDGPTISSYPTNTQILYSDDRGATWEFLPAASRVEGHGIEGQYTSIRVYKNAVVLGTDALATPFASIIYPKTGYRTLGTPVFSCGYVINLAVSEIQSSAYSLNDIEFPTFFGISVGSAVADATMLCTPDGGYTYYEIWRETDITTRPPISAGGIRRVLGPDTSGRICARYTGYNQLVLGTLVTGA